MMAAGECVGFQAQIASVVEILANSAVAEICRLVEDGYAALRSQMEQERQESDKENQALRQRLRHMDARVRNYERKMRRRTGTGSGTGSGSGCGSGAGCGVGGLRGGGHTQPALLRPQEEAMMVEISEDLIVPVTIGDEEMATQHDAEPLVKQEEDKHDCNLDLKVELNIRADCGAPSALEAIEDSSSAENMTPPPSLSSSIDLTCRPRAKRKPCRPQSAAGLSPRSPLKAEVQVIEDEEPPSQLSADVSEDHSPERSLDLVWMQERVTHLGAAYAVAQLGLGQAESAHGAFQTQSSDSCEAPPIMFPSSAQDMASFAASFDLSAVVATPQSASPAQATPPSSAGQRRAFKSVKEAAACNICGKLFPNAAAAQLHQRTHTGERPYACPHCGKGFAQPNNLRVHLLIHTGERRYRCTLCAKSFISSSHLKRHRTVHTQEKPYSCSRCGQSFSQMCSVRRHRQQSQCGL